MEPHQQRVVDEKEALDTKISALGNFIAGDFYKSLPHAEQIRLNIQLTHMQAYSQVLGERISAFE